MALPFAVMFFNPLQELQFQFTLRPKSRILRIDQCARAFGGIHSDRDGSLQLLDANLRQCAFECCVSHGQLSNVDMNTLNGCCIEPGSPALFPAHVEPLPKPRCDRVESCLYRMKFRQTGENVTDPLECGPVWFRWVRNG